jgi:Na+/H+-dicarboxylate symporter
VGLRLVRRQSPPLGAGRACDRVGDVRWYFRIPLGTRLVVAFVAGAAVGLVAGPAVASLAPAGRLLTDLLRLLAPLVVATFALSALSGGTLRDVGVTAGRALVGCVAMAVAAAAIGALTVAALSPLGPIGLPDSALVRPTGLWTTVSGWLPGHGAGFEKAVPLAFVVTVPAALAIGAWRARRPGGVADAIHRGLQRLAAGVTRALRIVLEYAPVGAFAAAAVMFGEAGGSAGAHLAGAIAGVYTAHAALAAVLLMAAACIGLRPLHWLRASREVLVTAVATGSSAATLPLELRVAEGPLGVPPAAARTILPLGTTFGKTGTTAFLGALGVAGGLVSGIGLEWTWVAQVILWSTVAGLATPPVSGGGFIMLALVFGQTGVPLAWVPVLTSLPLIGKLNTPLNALGRLLLAVALTAAPAPAPWTPPAAARERASL